MAKYECRDHEIIECGHTSTLAVGWFVIFKWPLPLKWGICAFFVFLFCFKWPYIVPVHNGLDFRVSYHFVSLHGSCRLVLINTKWTLISIISIFYAKSTKGCNPYTTNHKLIYKQGICKSFSCGKNKQNIVSYMRTISEQPLSILKNSTSHLPKKFTSQEFSFYLCTLYPWRPTLLFSCPVLRNKIPISEENLIMWIVFLREGIHVTWMKKSCRSILFLCPYQCHSKKIALCSIIIFW